MIGVDGGLNHCATLDITPQWIIGDFDSVESDVFKRFRQDKMIQLEAAKNLTDLEVAVKKAQQLNTTAQIVIFGGLGGRLDHTLSNIFLLLRMATDVGKRLDDVLDTIFRMLHFLT